MAHGTTVDAHLHTEGATPPQETWSDGGHTGQLPVDVDGTRFRVWPPRFTTQWLSDTPSNRRLAVVWFRLLGDDQGKPLFTWQELATLVGSNNRQAASQPL